MFRFIIEYIVALRDFDPHVIIIGLLGNNNNNNNKSIYFYMRIFER